MTRVVALLLPLALAGCGLSPALIGAGMGLLAGELKLGTAALQWMTAKDAMPPDCDAAHPPPCVLQPAKD